MRIIFLSLCLATGALATPSKDLVPISIEAKHVEFDQKSGRVVFKGHVRINRGTIKIECQKLLARYTAEGQLIELIIDSTLTIRGARFSAQAGHGHYIHESAELRLKDQPVVRQGPNQIRGTQVIVYVEDERVIVENPKGTVHVPTPAPGPSRK